jgi:hypothetical protein
MNVEKYYTTLTQLGGAEYHLGMLIKSLEEHFDPETRDYTTIVALDHAKRFLSEIKSPSIEESLQNINEKVA